MCAQLPAPKIDYQSHGLTSGTLFTQPYDPSGLEKVGGCRRAGALGLQELSVVSVCWSLYATGIVKKATRMMGAV